MRFRDKLISFMYGRNGADALCKFSLICAIVLSVINIFARSVIITLIGYIFIIYAFYRVLSKNIYKRQNENRKYLDIKKKCSSFLSLQKNKWNDRKTHVYHKCPHCRAMLRLPKVKGDHSVNCPCCHKSFDMKV